jgi:putative CocE/NonD family hydrolase
MTALPKLWRVWGKCMPAHWSMRCCSAHWGAAWLLPILVLGLLHARSGAQELEFHPPTSVRDERAVTVMRDLAERVLPVYQESHPERYLGSLSALQLVAGDYAAADATRQTLRARRLSANTGRTSGAALFFDIYAHARAVETKDHVPFEQAFAQTYRDVVYRLSDWDAYALTGSPPVVLSTLERTLQDIFNQRRAKGSISLADAVNLVRTYLSFDANRRVGTLIDVLGPEDDRRRYIIDNNVVIRSHDGARISAVLVRPRSATKPLPTLFEFTIHVAARNYARESAARGYVGVVAYTRGRGNARGQAVPFAHDGADARTVINWIAGQEWSDGRVGMYGDSYSAYAAWATLLQAPPALKAVATSDATAPGIDFPMQGNIFQNTAYRWLIDMTSAHASVDIGRDDEPRWRALYRSWYINGDACGDLDGLFGQPSAQLHRWLAHPSYDGFWQAMIPFGDQFGHIDVPILSVSGYYADAQVGALYYFQQHGQYNARANQILLIGPYEDGATLREPPLVLGPEPADRVDPIDPVAVVDLRELRYQWFDHMFRGGANPALLQDHVNFEVMGANTWRHVSSLPAMADGVMRFYLDPAERGDAHLLAQEKRADVAFLRQTVDLADRRDADAPLRSNGIGKALPSRESVLFVSEPLAQAVEISGLFSGRLDFVTNKWDMDLTISLYEQLPNGERFALFDPPYEFRASYANDRVHRRTLHAGERQQLNFRSERITSRLLQAGTRLVVVLGVNKRADQEINYGAAEDVRAQYIENAGDPLRIRWYANSYLEIPIQTNIASTAKP